MTEHGQDEILELLWTLREERKANRAEVLRSAAEPGPERLLEELAEGGMVDASGEEILLTKSGRTVPAGSSDVTDSRRSFFRACSTSTTHRWKTAPASSNISSPSPWSRVSAPFSPSPACPHGARSREGIAATGSGPRSAPSSCV